jgi:hypothetical protein
MKQPADIFDICRLLQERLSVFRGSAASWRYCDSDEADRNGYAFDDISLVI